MGDTDCPENLYEGMEMCDIHPNQPLKFYCVDCQEPCCIDCRQTTHYGHTAIDIAEAAERDRGRLSDMLEQLKITMVKFRIAKEKADAAVERMKVDGENVTAAVEGRRKEVKKMVDQLCDDGLEFIKEKIETDKKNSRTAYDEIKEDYDHLNSSISETEEVLRLSTDMPIVRAAKEIGNVLEKYKSIEVKKMDEKKLIHVPGLYGTQVLNNFCGLFGYEPLKLRQDFKFETEHFTEFSLIPETESEAWVSFYTSVGSALVKYNSSGEKLEDIALKPDGHARVLKLGREFLMTSKKDKKLLMYSSKEKPLETFAEVAFAPRGVAQTHDNKILICTSASNGGGDNALLVYSMRGELLKEVVEEDGKKIFVSPKFISVNINGDICVSDKGGSCVVILNKDLQVKARYIPPESLKLQTSFCPRGICCDKFGRILVADGCNNKVHLLSSQGKFLRFILDDTDGIKWPRLIETGPGDKLWVVCRGEINVFNYLNSNSV